MDGITITAIEMIIEAIGTLAEAASELLED
jgi:hypothetical protein